MTQGDAAVHEDLTAIRVTNCQKGLDAVVEVMISAGVCGAGDDFTGAWECYWLDGDLRLSSTSQLPSATRNVI